MKACNHDQPCGCNNDELTTLPNPCDTSGCVDGESCDQVIDCNCVIYTGPPIQEFDIQPGDSVCDILTTVINLGGIPGSQGDQGDQGDPGPQGDSAYDVWLSQGNVGTEQDFLNSLVGNAGASSPGIPGLSGYLIQDDTGWIDLEGFSYYTGSAETEKPKARRIGRTIHLKGKVYIPVVKTTVQNLTSVDETATNATSCYRSVDSCQTFGFTTPSPSQIAAGAVKISGQTFEFNGGTAVIPSTITSSNTDLSYKSTLFPVFRNIRKTVNVTNYSWIFTSFISIEITTNKRLIVKSLSDFSNKTVGKNDTLRVLVEDFGNTTKLKSFDYENDPNSTGFTPDQYFVGTSSQGESYGFDFDGYDINDLGGFSFSLDGIILTLPKVSLATITGSAVSGITSSGASVSSSISSNNGTISYKGVVFGLTTNPTINNSYVIDTTTTNSINCTITGLSSGILYYVRSFCINDAGVSYGSQSSFTTL